MRTVIRALTGLTACYHQAMGALRLGWISPAWREAWATRHDNPLPKLWRLAEARQTQRRPWWQRNPGLMLWGLALSAVATYLLWLVLGEFLGVRHSAVASLAFAHGMCLAGVQIFTTAAGAFCLCWLLSRIYSLAYFTLALLGRTRRRDSAGLDEPVLASSISDEQIVLAVVLHAWRMVRAPLLAFNVCAAALYCIWLNVPSAMAQGINNSISPTPLALALLLGLELVLLQTIGAMAGTALLSLILVMLGRATGPFAPTFGAVSQVLWQGLLALAMATSTLSFEDEQGQHPGWWIVLTGVVLAVAWVSFFFWLAHRSSGLRTACAHSLFVFLFVQALLQFWASLAGSDMQAFASSMSYFTGISLLLLSMPPAAGLHHLGGVFGGLYSGAKEFLELLSDAGLLMALQALLCIPLSLLAREAVRRFRGGTV
jgi:hypothetical protein